MPELTEAALLDDIDGVLGLVLSDGERFRIIRDGQPVAALIPIDDLDLLEEIEDRIDIRAAEEAMAEALIEGFVPWEEVQRELDQAQQSDRDTSK
jgi:antitoxin (DNA-binding transcriptional repressor) of toxin-antitoxin stability system